MFELSPGQILELPYIGEELSMLILLPYQKEDNTADLEKVGHANVLLRITAELNLGWFMSPSAGEDAHLWQTHGVDRPKVDGCRGGPGGPAPLQAGGAI